MNKTEFKEKAKQKIDVLFERIDHLENQKSQLSQDAQERYNLAIDKLKSKKTDLEIQFRQLQNASENKWEETKTAFSKASESFQKGIDEIISLAN